MIGLIEKYQRKTGPKETFVVLMVYYIYQCCIPGFVFSAEIIFQKNGATLADQGTISIVSYPFMFKMIYAPFMDVVFWKRFGKRKSYIVPMSVLAALLLIVYAFYIETWLDNLEINTFTLAFLILIVIITFQDVAIDAVGVSMFDPEYRKHSATTESLGYSIGSFIGFNVFTYLNSVEFINDYLYETTKPILTPSSFLVCIAILGIGVSLYFMFFVKEPTHDNPEVNSLCDAYKLFSSFWKNTNLRYYCIWRVFVVAGHLALVCSIEFKMISEGLDRATLSSIHLAGALPNALALFLTGHYAKNNYLSKMVTFLFINGIFCCLLLFPYGFFEPEENYTLTSVVFGIIWVGKMSTEVYYMMNGAFLSKNADPALASTFKTFLYSVGNASQMLSKTFYLKVVDYFNYYGFVLFFMGFQFIFLVSFRCYALRLDKLPPRAFRLTELNETQTPAEGVEMPGVQELNETQRSQGEEKAKEEPFDVPSPVGIEKEQEME